MEYRAVGNRCAVAFGSLELPITVGEAHLILSRKGFRALDTDVVSTARRCIGSSRFLRRAKVAAAPGLVDCSSFTKWVYGVSGIWIPRLSIQQRAFCQTFGQSVPLDSLIGGELVFSTGAANYYHDDPDDNVGHVGIATGDGTVIHAVRGKAHVTEVPLEQYADKSKLRGVYRLIPRNTAVVTFQIPPDAERDIETSDDFRWLILESLSWMESKQIPSALSANG